MTTADMIREKSELIKDRFDEKNRRHWASVGAKAIGRGGMALVPKATGMSGSTMTAGIKETNRPAKGDKRVRSPGGGRGRIVGKEPNLSECHENLAAPVIRGEPESPLGRTCKSTRNLAEELGKQGFRIGDRKVARLLRDPNYSLRANRKSRELTSHPDRSA